MEQRPYTRERFTMAEDVRCRLGEAGLTSAYEARPPYQRNDYLGWIERARRPETRQKRIRQMLEELEQGGVYMKMRHDASTPPGEDRAGPHSDAGGQ